MHWIPTTNSRRTSTEYAIGRIEAIRRWGAHSNAVGTLQPGLRYLDDHDGGYLAYLSIGGSTLGLGDPVAPERNKGPLLEQFVADYPDASFVHVEEPTARLLAGLGYYVNSMGPETRLKLPYSLHGKSKRDVRQLYNRGRANGVTLHELLSPPDRLHCFEYLRQHQAATTGRFGRDLSFLVRPVDPLADDDSRWFAAILNGQPVGLSVFDPLYDEGRIFGYTEAHLRRHREAPKGTRVYALVQALKRFEQEGIEHVNLGLLPFASRTPEGMPASPLTERLFQTLHAVDAPFFNFHGISFHKSRFRGRLTTVYFASRKRLPLLDIMNVYRATTGRRFLLF